jgi:hypothetical protein
MTLSAYVQKVQDIVNSERGPIWLRGHSSAMYRLIPSVLRDTIPLISPRGWQLEGHEIIRAGGGIDTGPNPERMLSDFKRRALPFVKMVPRNDFEWLFLMQHHGVPTRLLDWTTNALVALYFAVDGVKTGSESSVDSEADEEMSLNEFDENSAAVFLMNPTKINQELHIDVSAPVDVAAEYDRWHPYSRPMEFGEAYAPICIVAPQVSPRIRAQAGLFTLHGANLEPLDYYMVTRPLIKKILIPHSAALTIRAELHSLGITPSFIFPDLDGVAREVRENELRTFSWERERYLANIGDRR